MRATARTYDAECTSVAETVIEYDPVFVCWSTLPDPVSVLVNVRDTARKRDPTNEADVAIVFPNALADVAVDVIALDRCTPTIRLLDDTWVRVDERERATSRMRVGDPVIVVETVR